MKILEHQALKSAALWVKENVKTINVFAGIFYLFTFIAGLFWAMGAEIEPITFVLGL